MKGKTPAIKRQAGAKETTDSVQKKKVPSPLQERAG